MRLLRFLNPFYWWDVCDDIRVHGWRVARVKWHLEAVNRRWREYQARKRE